MHTSPFLTRDKSSSSKRRVIVDLSWPIGNSVNSNVVNDRYEGVDFALTFPSIDTVTKAVCKFGKHCKIAKIDISRAFKHLPIDPKDIKYLGLYWEGYYIEKNLCFGYKNGSSLYQRFSDCIRFILHQEGHFSLNYIDDHLILGKASNCQKGFQRLKELIPELGLTISNHKTVELNTEVTCLGIVVNTTDFTVSIPDKKLLEVKNMCINWKNKKTCTKRELQSLLGSLLYVSKCVKYSRFFLNRLLQTLRDNHKKKYFKLDQNLQKDIAWFSCFFTNFQWYVFFPEKNH